MDPIPPLIAAIIFGLILAAAVSVFIFLKRKKIRKKTRTQ
jgi:hypothetical protein